MTTDFSATRAAFDLPPEMIYLDGNSLGPLTHAARARITQTVSAEWGQMLITAWNKASWIDLPSRVGARIARLIGAREDCVMTGDTLSIKLWQALAAASALVPERRVILSDSGNFPSDLYIAQGFCQLLTQGWRLETVAPEAVEARITEDIGIVMVTEVDYRSGRRHNMRALTRRAHEMGAIVVRDLAHSAGALALDLTGDDCDFAVGCSYKFLNGGPGAPAFIYAAPRHHATLRPALSGWLGHEAPFAFDPDYRPATGVERLRVGTPAIVQLSGLDAALDVWDLVDMNDLETRMIALAQNFIAGVEREAPELILISPRDPALRGAQVSFRHPQGYAIMQALIAHGVIGDFRAPDVLRFGITPLYTSFDEIEAATTIIGRVMRESLWDRPAFHQRAKVT